MPHIIVEYTDHLNADIPKLLHTLHFALADQDTVSLEAIKTRAIPVQAVLLSDGSSGDRMVHVNVKLLPGRNDALKKTMSGALWKIIFDHIKDDRVYISVEISELHASSYIKSADQL